MVEAVGIEPTSEKLRPEASTCVSFPLKSRRSAWAEGFRHRSQSQKYPGGPRDPASPIDLFNDVPAVSYRSDLGLWNGRLSYRQCNVIVGSCVVFQLTDGSGTPLRGCLFPVETGAPPEEMARHHVAR